MNFLPQCGESKQIAVYPLVQNREKVEAQEVSINWWKWEIIEK